MVLWRMLASTSRRRGVGAILLLAENRSQAADLSTEGSTDVLGSVRDEVLDAAHDVVEENVAIHESAEAGDLASDSGSDLGLVVLEELHECGDKISRDDLLVNCLGDLQLLVPKT